VTDPRADPSFVAGLRPVPTELGDEPPAWPAVDLAGVGPDGTPVTVELASRHRRLLLVFLTTDCDGCESFWNGLRAPLDGADAVVVTKGRDSVDVAAVAARAGAVPVVMGDAAWVDYRVTGYPFLVLVDPPSRRILAERVGFGWPDVEALLAR